MAAAPYTGDQTDLCIGTMFFEYKNWGWSEKYYINSPNAPGVPSLFDASFQLAAGCQYRAFLLGAGCRISYARVSLWSTLRDSINAIYSPLDAGLVDAEEEAEVINSPEVSAVCRHDDMAGRFVLRGFRGLRDSWVEDAALTATLFSQNPTVSTVITPAVPPLLDTASNAVKNFILWMKQNTVIARKNLLIPDTWTTYPISFHSFRKIGKRDTGRPFGTSRGRQPSFS